MRFRFKEGADKELQSDLNTVQEILNSGYFIFIDLCFWALLLTILTKTALPSIQWMVIIYICYYLFGVALFLLLRTLCKDSPS